jgi:hypothetical protein
MMRHVNLRLIGLWLCAVYFVLLGGFLWLGLMATPMVVVSDYNPDRMTREDLVEIRDKYAKVWRIGAVGVTIGAVPLLIVALSFQGTTTPK